MPDNFLAKWQKTVDLMARIFEVPVGMIMKVHQDEIEVLLASISEGNPYRKGERSRLGTGLYCEEVMKNKSQILIPNALNDPKWENYPCIYLNMIAYLGVPLFYPNGDIFGTICVMDKKPRKHSESYQALIWHFKDLIEADLKILENTKELERCQHHLKDIIDEKTKSLLREIDAHQKTVNKFRRRNEILEKIFSTTHLLIAYMDRDFNFIRVNERYAEAEKKTVDFFVGKNHFDLYPNRNNQIIFQEVVNTGRSYSATAKSFRYPNRPEKPTYWNWTLEAVKDEKGLVEGLLLSLQDVTEKKEAELALKESQTFVEQIVENIPDMIFVKDAKDLRFVRLNRAGQELLGYERDELLGKNDYDFYPKKEADFFTKKDKEVLNKKKLLDIPEELIETKNRGKRVLHTKKIPIFNQNGIPEFLLGISEDITEKLKAEREKTTLENQLRQAHKMEAIGTLAGGIAHDFNNILTAIIGYTDLAMDLQPPGTAQNYLEQVLKGGILAKELVQQILSFSRKTQEKKKNLKIAPVIKEALKLIRSTLPATVSITDNIMSDCGHIIGNSINIHQIFVNLCTNALHAMENEKGILTVGLTLKELQQNDLQGETGISEGTFVELEVSDTGSGMDNETIERIFEPYFTTKETGKGSGMGLAVVHGIVKEYGGFIRVRSEPGKGSSFRVYFPSIEGKIVEQKKKRQLKLPEGSESILVVDDEESIVTMFKLILEDLGYKITTFTSSTETVEAFLTDPEAFDLIITDQTLPGLAGDELAAKILKIRPNIPIIICTGYSSLLSEKRPEDIGVEKILMKPVERQTLAHTIRDVLDRKKFSV